MSRRFSVLVFVITGLLGLAVWLAFTKYKPSPDGFTEEAIALSDMRRYCQAAQLDCTDIRVRERIAPVRDSDGHWEFVIGLGEAGPHYMVAVTPGVESQVVPLASQ